MAEADSKDNLVSGALVLFDIRSRPGVESESVKNAKEELLHTSNGDGMQVEQLANSFIFLKNCLLVAYCGVAGQVDLQIGVREVGFKITDLCRDTTSTVYDFHTAAGDVLDDLEAAYGYLLNAKEHVALTAFEDIDETAGTLAEEAEGLAGKYDAVRTEVQELYKETTKTKAGIQTQIKEDEKKIEELQLDQEKLEREKQAALKLMEEFQKEYSQMHGDELKVMNDDWWLEFWSRTAQSAVAAVAVSVCEYIKSAWRSTTDFAKSLSTSSSTKPEKTTDMEATECKSSEDSKNDGTQNPEKTESIKIELSNSGSDNKLAAKLQAIHNKMDKIRNDIASQLQKEMDSEHEIKKLALTIKYLSDQKQLTEVTPVALQLVETALLKISTQLRKAASFWKGMQKYSKNLKSGAIKKRIKANMEDQSVEERKKFYKSDTFTKEALKIYSKWVAIECICKEYAQKMVGSREELYKFLEYNPTDEEALKRVSVHAECLGEDAKDNIEELKKKQKALNY